jgi:hypothetical protein
MLTGVLGTRSCWQPGPAGQCAAAFQQNDVIPEIVNVTVAFAIADFAETTFKMQGAAGLIAGDNLCLQSPVGFGFGSRDQCA